MPSIPHEEYYLGLLYKNAYYLIGCQTSICDFAYHNYSSINEAQKAFSMFNFLFERLPHQKEEANLLNLLDNVDFLIFCLPIDISSQIEKYTESTFYSYPDQFPLLFNRPGSILKVKTGKQINNYIVYHLNTDILNKNPRIHPNLRPLSIGNNEASGNDLKINPN